jgi:hypothetical protein
MVAVMAAERNSSSVGSLTEGSSVRKIRGDVLPTLPNDWAEATGSSKDGRSATGADTEGTSSDREMGSSDLSSRSGVFFTASA